MAIAMSWNVYVWRNLMVLTSLLKKQNVPTIFWRIILINFMSFQKKKKSSKGENVPGCMRSLLVSCTCRLRAAIIKAIKYRKQQNNISYEDSIKMLKKVIVNSPNHIFGDHENCSNYFCKRKNLGRSIIMHNINS
jgi:hypothetical protein